MIQDVIKTNIATHNDDRGFFREIFRFKENFNDIEVGQLSHSLAKEQVVKGWHGHFYQHQWNYIISGSAKITLYDDRKNSPTYESIDTFIIDGENNSIGYYFPPGVLHGYRCISGPMNIIYVTSGKYDLDDELRKEITYRDLNKTLD